MISRRTSFASFLLILALFLFGPLTAVTSASGPDLGDKTSNGNDLTNSNGVSGSSDTPFGSSTQSSDFVASSNQCLQGPNVTALKPTGNFTIETWVKFTSMPGALNYPKFFQSYSENSGIAGITLGVSGDNNKPYLIVGKATGWTEGTDFKQLFGSTVLTTGTWYHIAGVYNGSTLELFVNGVSDGSVSWSGDPAYATTNYVRIGCSDRTGTDEFFLNGSVDDVRLWDVARTQLQISANYQSNLVGNESGLVGYYPFDSATSSPSIVYTPPNTLTFYNPSGCSPANYDVVISDTNYPNQGDGTIYEYSYTYSNADFPLTRSISTYGMTTGHTYYAMLLCDGIGGNGSVVADLTFVK